MSWTLNDIQVQIASELDQSATAPTEGGTDWNIRRNVINRALFDWRDSYDWSALKTVYNGRISTSTGNASLALPSDFSKLDGYVRIMSDGSTAYDFPVEDPSNNTLYVNTDKFVNLLGNEADNKVMYIHCDTLASGASVQFVYFKSPASLASAVDVAEVPDPTYLVQRALYYLYKGREDGRFPEAKIEADRILARMIENENVHGRGYLDRNVPVNSADYRNWRIGRD